VTRERGVSKEIKETKVKSVWRARRETWASKANVDTSDQPASMELRVPRARKDQRVHQVKLDPLARLERRERSVSLDLLDTQVDQAIKETRELKVEMVHRAAREREAKMDYLANED